MIEKIIGMIFAMCLILLGYKVFKFGYDGAKREWKELKEEKSK